MKLLVVDDHALVREGLCKVLQAPGAEPCEILEASDGAAALAAIRARPDLDLALLDFNLPDMSGFDVLKVLAREHSALPVAILSGDNNPALMRAAIDLGASGFIPKNVTLAVLLSALRLILAGGIYVPSAALISLGYAPSGDDAQLTRRQRDVYALLLTGKSNKEICRSLGLAEPTVKNHISAILRELGVNNRTQAILAAVAARNGAA